DDRHRGRDVRDRVRLPRDRDEVEAVAEPRDRRRGPDQREVADRERRKEARPCPPVSHRAILSGAAACGIIPGLGPGRSGPTYVKLGQLLFSRGKPCRAGGGEREPWRGGTARLLLSPKGAGGGADGAVARPRLVGGPSEGPPRGNTRGLTLVERATGRL